MPLTESSHAVFLSYASQDAQAAQRICAALRSAGIEVWFDQSELRGGDAWDQSIRKQIKTCALFLPIISRNTHERVEGYFRLEWKLGVDRSHLIAADQAFLLPLVIDDTRDDDERVPERFREVQWTRLPRGETPPAFVERVRRLLAGESSAEPVRAGTPPAQIAPAALPRKPVLTQRAMATVAVLALIVALGYVATRFVPTQRGAEPTAATAPATQGAAVRTFSPPPHSVAVLPFVNLSGDKEQEYFSDGLTEELLNSLAEIEGLQVAARTSAFSFKGQDNDIGTIARKLNVGAVLEGSVRRSAHTVRVTAQLINTVTGFHLWSKTYDRDLGDVLKLQTEIATAVAGALKVTLLGDVAAKVALGGTDVPAAFDAYLRAAKAYTSRRGRDEIPAAIAAYTEAMRLDPHYALAVAGRSLALSTYAEEAVSTAEVREGFEKARADAHQALALAPDLAEAHLALATVQDLADLDFARANESYERALALAPGNAQVLRSSASFAAAMGHFEAALAAARRAVVLDPLARGSHGVLGGVLYSMRRYPEAVSAYTEAIRLEPGFQGSYGSLGLTYYALGELERARATCATTPEWWFSQQCLAVAYHRSGRQADAAAKLAKLQATQSDAAAYQYATIYAEWGQPPKALEWLETALRLRDPGLENLKTDPLVDSLRKEPRFQAVLRELKFPD